nr:hypothetical protein [Neorhizobium tomejilense]
MQEHDALPEQELDGHQVCSFRIIGASCDRTRQTSRIGGEASIALFFGLTSSMPQRVGDGVKQLEPLDGIHFHKGFGNSFHAVSLADAVAQPLPRRNRIVVETHLDSLWVYGVPQATEQIMAAMYSVHALGSLTNSCELPGFGTPPESHSCGAIVIVLARPISLARPDETI